MSYKVSFYGDRRPETLPDASGEQLYKDFASGNLPDRVEVRKGLTVERRSIREVEKIKEKKERSHYSSKELTTFEKDKLQKFLDERGELTFWGEQLFLQSEGFIRVEKKVEKPRSMADISLWVKPHMIRVLIKTNQKLSQWKYMHGHKNYAVRKQVEAVAKSIHA